MRNIILLCGFLLIFTVGFFVVSDVDTLWGQEETVTSKGKAGVNLQFLEIDTIVELNQTMKTIAKSLGVDCKFCHDLKNFPGDEIKHKLIARDMMKMVKEINGKFFKDQEEQIACFTCHRGRHEPIHSLAQLKKIEEEEKEQ